MFLTKGSALVTFRTTTHFAALALLQVLSCGSMLLGADQAADKAAIEKAVASYTAAFNVRNVKALDAHGLPEAVCINPLTGRRNEATFS